MCSNAYFRFFRGGGHFWRVTLVRKLQYYNKKHLKV